MSEALGMAFGLMVICCSIIWVYLWAIRPERDARRREADRQLQQRHHWYREKWRKNKPTQHPS